MNALYLSRSTDRAGLWLCAAIFTIVTSFLLCVSNLPGQQKDDQVQQPNAAAIIANDQAALDKAKAANDPVALKAAEAQFKTDVSTLKASGLVSSKNTSMHHKTSPFGAPDPNKTIIIKSNH